MDEKVESWLRGLRDNGARLSNQMPVRNDLYASLMAYEKAGRFRDAAELYLVYGGYMDDIGGVARHYLRKAGMYAEAARTERMEVNG